MKNPLLGARVIRRRRPSSEPSGARSAGSKVVVGPWVDSEPVFDPTPHRDHWVREHAGFRWMTRARGLLLTEQEYSDDPQLQALALRELELALEFPRAVRRCVGERGPFLLLDLGPAWALIRGGEVRTILTRGMADRHPTLHRRLSWSDL